jgi:hypothetical protein
MAPRRPGCDACSSLRKSYAACLRALTLNRWIGGACTLLPIAYIFSFMLTNSVGSYALAVYLMGPGWTIFSVLLMAWILMVICLWQRCPNLLSVSIFLFTCFGHWALVSFVVVLGYASRDLSRTSVAAATQLGSYFTAGLLPPVLLLLLAADVLRTQRDRMFEELAATAAATEDAGLSQNMAAAGAVNGAGPLESAGGAGAEQPQRVLSKGELAFPPRPSAPIDEP